MTVHTIPADTFFKGSPEIRITYKKAEKDLAQLVLSTHAEEDQVPKPDATQIDCFLRKASDDERDKHIARLQGVQRMDTFLRKVGDKAKLLQHGKVGALEISIRCSVCTC